MKIKASVICWAVFLTSVAILGPTLPDNVATHFVSSGHPNGWMSRSDHLIFSTLFGIGFSSFVIGICYLARFLPASMLNVPHAEYWGSPKHFPEACDYLFGHSFWFGTLASLWVTAFHYLIVQANRAVPVVLDSATLLGLTLVFFTVTAVWIAAMLWHFAHPGERSFAMRR